LKADRAPNGQPLPTIFHTAAISTGNSGGPLLDACGRVIGVNTWAAAGRVAQDGSVSLAVGQNVASQASTLIVQLRANSTPFTPDESPCVTAGQAARAEADVQLAEAEAALAQLKKEQAALAAEREANAKFAQSAAALGGWVGVIVSLAAALGGAYLVRRNHPSRGPGSLVRDILSGPAAIPIGALAAVSIGAGAASALLFANLNAFRADVAATSPASGQSSLDRSGASAPPGALAGDPGRGGGVTVACVGVSGSQSNLSFALDEQRQCVNRRTFYARTRDGLERLIVHARDAAVTRNFISADRRTFTQTEFPISVADWEAWKRASSSMPACPAQADGVQQAEKALAEFARAAPALPTIGVRSVQWLCQKP
jgi:hypothetical protein